MSISIPFVELASARHDPSMPARAKMLADWCQRHGVKRYSALKQGVCPCKIGKHPNCICRCRRPWGGGDKRSSWVDHTETFMMGGIPAIVTSEPYDLPEGAELKRVVEYLSKLGLVAFQHPQEESSYFPGRTYLIAILKDTPEHGGHYLAREPNAKRWGV